MTALSWFFEIRGFSPSEIDPAFDYLEIATTERQSVRVKLAEMRLRLLSDDALTTTDAIANVDDVITERLPKLRARVQAQAAGRRGT